MTYLERLDEAIKEWSYSYESLEPVLDAARAYRNLLANGEREPDYEAVFRKADELGWEGEEQLMGELIEIVDAALEYLVDPPKEEE